MQPYFFPYIGYFNLINLSDKFIIFDTPQYIQRGWINRNRILRLNGGSSYINVTIHKAPLHTPIREISINNNQRWREKILGQLSVYKEAPNYKDVMDFVQESFEYETDSIVNLNVHLLKKTCDYIQIPHSIEILSQMNCQIPETCKAGEWALHVSQALNAKVCLNPPGGMNFHDKSLYKKNKIDLQFISNTLRKYNQRRDSFETALSILDVMMFNSKEEIHEMLDEYEIL